MSSARQLGQCHSPSGTLVSGGARQNMWYPLSQRSHRMIWSSYAPPPHSSHMTLSMFLIRRCGLKKSNIPGSSGGAGAHWGGLGGPSTLARFIGGASPGLTKAGAPSSEGGPGRASSSEAGKPSAPKPGGAKPSAGNASGWKPSRPSGAKPKPGEASSFSSGRAGGSGMAAAAWAWASAWARAWAAARARRKLSNSWRCFS